MLQFKTCHAANLVNSDFVVVFLAYPGTDAAECACVRSVRGSRNKVQSVTELDVHDLILPRRHALVHSSSSIVFASSHCSNPTSTIPSPQNPHANGTSRHIAVHAVHDPRYGATHVPLLFHAPKSHCSQSPDCTIASPHDGHVTTSI